MYKYDRVLLSLPVGLGKTVIGAYLVDAWKRELHKDFSLPPRVLWLAHQDELIWQAVKMIRQFTGEDPAVEKGVLRANEPLSMFRAPVVVSSIQTMWREDRRAQFGRGEFGIIVLDECHHVVSPSFKEVVNYFGGAKLVGLTATTDRLDEISLGQIFEDVAYHYELLDAIKDGWCAPIKQAFIDAKVEFADVRLSGGDLSAEDLGRIIEEERPIHRIVAAAVELSGDRQTMIFAPTVNAAKAIAAVIPRYTDRGVVVLHGASDLEERQEGVEHYRASNVQYLVSCAIFLEGFDAPRTSHIVMCRPTKSRMLYAQAIGRGLRGGRNCPVEGKTDCLVSDLVGASKHKLIHGADLLGGSYHDVVVEEAGRMLWEQGKDGEPGDVLAELLAAAAQADELKRRQRQEIIGKAKMRRKTIDPFDLLDIPDRNLPGWHEAKPPTEAQVEVLEKQGIKCEGAFDFTQASQLLDDMARRSALGLCSYKMARIMASYGYDPNMKMEDAGKIIEQLKKRGWQHTGREYGNWRRNKKRK